MTDKCELCTKNNELQERAITASRDELRTIIDDIAANCFDCGGMETQEAGLQMYDPDIWILKETAMRVCLAFLRGGYNQGYIDGVNELAKKLIEGNEQ